MKKILTLDTQIKAVEDEQEDLKITGYASTNSRDRADDVILADAWTVSGGLKNYEKNPILLFNHNYDTPIGKVTILETDKKGLKITGVISKNAPGNVHGLVKDGVLSTFSVGFLVKDAEWDKFNEGFVIKDAELLEVSVVSVPCNQDATFSVAKSFSTEEEYTQFKNQFDTTEQNAEPEASKESIKMDEKELQELLAKAAADGAAAAVAASEKAAKEKADAAAAKVAAEAEINAKVAAAVTAATIKMGETAEEKIVSAVEAALAEKDAELGKVVAELKTELTEKSEEITKLAKSKRVFSDRGDTTDSWKKEFAEEMDNAFLLGRVTSKGYDTEYAKNLLEKVNTHSSISVSSSNFEQEVSTNIERDIQQELILAPMFREITLNAATMILPILPDAGYAEITAAAGSTTAVPPHGTLDPRGGTDRSGIQLQEISLSTVKMVAKSYLGNETEEDAILPILPLIRESMIRQHARGVENMLLLGGHTDGAYPSITSATGLLTYASTQSRDVATGTVGTLPALTADRLLSLRKGMGKYGLRAKDIVYVVSMRGYFELLEDPEFQDFNLVSNMATKLTGEVGQVFGTSVVVCDEFPAPAAGKYYALALNKRNFVVPRLRGLTVESEYSVEDQHRVLVTTQRLGFKEIIPNAKSVFALKYPAAS